MNNKRVNIKNLNVYYKQGKSSMQAAKGVDLDIKEGEVVALIGESGSGKTTVAKAMLGYIPFYADEVRIGETNVPSSPALINKRFRRDFATVSQMIFQSPSASLNHHKRVWKTVAEGMYNIKLTKKEQEAFVDSAQRFYKSKILKFSDKLKSKKLEQKIAKFSETLDEIRVVNKEYLSYDSSKTTLLANKELVELDAYYNDKLEDFKNDVDSAFNVKEFKTTVRKRNIARYWKAQFRATEALISDKNKRNNELDRINKQYKEDIKVVKDKEGELNNEYKLTKFKLASQYKETLEEYANKRTELIKKIKTEGIVKKNKEKKKELKNRIDKLYVLARQSDHELFKMMDELAVKKGLEKEYHEHKHELEAKLTNHIKTKKRPFGSRKDIKKKAFELIEQVGLTSNVGYSFSSQLSGGQQQRVAIARAFSMKPNFIVADEPIASLDVSLQGSIVNLIKKLAKEIGTSVLFISHDLEMTKRIASRTFVMYRGSIVEKGKTSIIFGNPLHPYTRMLVSSTKTIDEALSGKKIRAYKSSDHVSGGISEFRKISREHFVFGNEKEIQKWKGDK